MGGQCGCFLPCTRMRPGGVDGAGQNALAPIPYLRRERLPKNPREGKGTGRAGRGPADVRARGESRWREARPSAAAVRCPCACGSGGREERDGGATTGWGSWESRF